MVIAATPNHVLPRLARRVVPQRTADIMIDVLARSGIDTVFGVPGGAIATLYDALLDRSDIRVVTTRSESGAMFAALGFAFASGRPAAVLVTSGPGVLNCLPGLASAMCDSLPVVVLAGEVPRSSFGKGALQEGSANHLNIVAMSRPATKLSVELTDAGSAPAVLKRAINTSTSGRPGPVLLTLPFDVTGAVINRPGLSAGVSVRTELDVSVLRKVSGTLASAERPLILAGSGTRWGGGPAQLLSLAERLQAPVVTTPKGKGVFPESHPLSLGVFGHGGHPSASAYLNGGVDVLLAVGTSFSDPATDGWSEKLIPRDHLIQIDVDALRIGRNYPVSLGLVGRADDILAGIQGELPMSRFAERRFGVKRHSDPALEGTGSEGRITPQRALWELQRSIGPSGAFTSDIGEHLLFATHYLNVDDAKGFLAMTGLASMGSGVAGAVGYALARPERRVVSIVGDGCFAMSLGDVAAAVRHEVPLVVAVLNDQRYAMVELGNLAIYGRTPDYGLDEINVAALAESVGADARRIEQPGEILGLDLASRSSRRPLILDVRIDRSVRIPKTRIKQFAASVGTSLPSPTGEA